MALIAIWVAMAPIPIIPLPPMANHVELTILDMPLAKVYAVGTVFAVIPLMVVAMVAIVIAGMIPVVVADYDFLGSATSGCHRGYESRSQKKKTQISVSSMHGVLRNLRTHMLKFWLVGSVRRKASGVCTKQDTAAGTFPAEGVLAIAPEGSRVTTYPKTDRPSLQTSA
jgi:hypothetical protein